LAAWGRFHGANSREAMSLILGLPFAEMACEIAENRRIAAFYVIEI
jgi:hypothetical protein